MGLEGHLYVQNKGFGVFSWILAYLVSGRHKSCVWYLKSCSGRIWQVWAGLDPRISRKNRIYRPLIREKCNMNDRPREGPILGFLPGTPQVMALFSGAISRAGMRFSSFPRLSDRRLFRPRGAVSGTRRRFIPLRALLL